ncbi:MAG TPA: exodeoxyribonuclease VII large subunit [Nannocystis exedens]|nr:exodeoxyribonuclease VII large subunit [Nannocystis exedens]
MRNSVLNKAPLSARNHRIIGGEATPDYTIRHWRHSRGMDPHNCVLLHRKPALTSSTKLLGRRPCATSVGMTRYTLRTGSRRPHQSDDGRPRVFTVGELVGGANRLLETTYSTCWVEGEVSNLRIVSSGHAYFTLKDSSAVLPVAMWRSSLARLRFRLENGQSLRLLGRLGIYPAQGKFQLYAERAEPAGLGAMMLQLEQLKKKLSAEGLFARDRKRPLPTWPQRIGVVTSPTGAAIHDILKVIRRRCPSRVLLAPAVVQGESAPASLLKALHRLQAIPDIDVIIIGRGGGAAEDLWAFNDEALVRAIAACRVPVISAVGHEVDTSLCDYAADLRAATPSHAAELVVPDASVYRRRVDDHQRRLRLAFHRRLLDERSRLDHASHQIAQSGRRLLAQPRRHLATLLRRLQSQHPRQRLAADRRTLSQLTERLMAHHPRMRATAARRRLEHLRAELSTIASSLTRNHRLRLARAAGTLDALSPLKVLERGFAVTTDRQGNVITSAEQVALGDRLGLRLHRGMLEVEVRGSSQD